MLSAGERGAKSHAGSYDSNSSKVPGRREEIRNTSGRLPHDSARNGTTGETGAISLGEKVGLTARCLALQLTTVFFHAPLFGK